jgi:hypothetical protein
MSKQIDTGHPTTGTAPALSAIRMQNIISFVQRSENDRRMPHKLSTERL